MVKYDGNLKMEEELAKLSWPEAPKIATKLPGPKSKEILEKEDAYETVAEMAPRGIPIAWGEAFGSTVKDPDGNLFMTWSPVWPQTTWGILILRWSRLLEESALFSCTPGVHPISPS